MVTQHINRTQARKQTEEHHNRHSKKQIPIRPHIQDWRTLGNKLLSIMESSKTMQTQKQEQPQKTKRQGKHELPTLTASKSSITIGLSHRKPLISCPPGQYDNMERVTSAVNGMKNDKSPGANVIPAEAEQSESPTSM
jgi:hypothetical protein